MDYKQEHDILEKFAAASRAKVLMNREDLQGDDKLLPAMREWCVAHKHIVVLQNADILSSRPGNRDIQNCKIALRQQGYVPGLVRPASSELIAMLLTRAPEFSAEADVSTQQQRLRVLIREALELGASDIHIEVRAARAKIRIRKHGELFLHAEWPTQLATEVCAVAFNKETDYSVTHFNPLVPQSASMPLDVEGREVRLRLASLPAHLGFDVVMRILASQDEVTLSLSELGYAKEQVHLIEKAIRMPHGAVIISGPTGSGKTTTLASCMNQVAPTRKVYTIEDPVEKALPHATQVPVNTDHYDRDFASMAKTSLRMDPDVMMIGEMRDEDTAVVLSRAAITGHLVFSTLHTNSAMDIVTRLGDLGVPYSLLGSPNMLICLICQRLVPMLCPTCSQKITQVDSEIDARTKTRWQQFFAIKYADLRVRGRGCTQCGERGIVGRRVVAEIIWVDEIGRRLISDHDMVAWRRHLLDHGWQSYQMQLLEKIRQGLVDPHDGENIMGEFDPQWTSQSFDYGQNALALDKIESLKKASIAEQVS